MIESIVGAALWAILTSCIFGATLFAVVALVVRSSAVDATIRHVLWTVALGTTALMPFVALAVGVSHAAPPASIPVRAQAAPERTSRTSAASVPQIRFDEPRRPAASANAARWWLRGDWQPRPNRALALVLVVIWLAGALFGVAGIVSGLMRVRGLKRRSSPLDTLLAAELPWLTQTGPAEREIYLRLCYEIETPVAVGFRRPTILIPMDLATQGGLGAIEGLILHEHAHLRRYDDWTNLAQRLIERIFWFNPLVWMFGRRIALEREIAADDAVVAATGRPEAYAKSLWQLAREMRMPEHTIVAPGALSTRKQISVRIEALLDRRPVGGVRRAAASLATALAAAVCTIAAAAAAPTIAVPAAPPIASAAHRAEFPAMTIAFVPRPPAHSRPIIAVTAPHAAGATPATQRAAAIASPSKTIAQTTTLLTNTDLSGANLRGVDWRGRTIENVHLAGADLAGAQLDDTHFIDSDLTGADLDGASLRGAVLSSTSVIGASLRDAHTTGLRIFGASLAGMTLRDLDVRSIITSCGGCNMTGADLRGTDLHGLRLSGINLSGADLRRANLAAAKLDGVNLSGADLRNTDLSGTAFKGCTLVGADLRGALRTGTSFFPIAPAVDDNARSANDY